MSGPPVACRWLPELAAGYLREFPECKPVQRGSVWGYLYERKEGRTSVGFFAGFLTARPRGAPRSSPTPLEPPACAIFAYVKPAGSPLHRKLIAQPGSLFRRSFELLTKYTTRRPRFEFSEKGPWALIRHAPLAGFPAGDREKYARNFFVETLALVVRSNLPAKLGSAPLR